MSIPGASMYNKFNRKHNTKEMALDRTLYMLEMADSEFQLKGISICYI